MPDQSELFDLTKKHLIGRLVTSTVSGARIEDISMPGEAQFKHMLVLSAADFGNHSGIRIMDEELPFFARDEVFYKGQPVLAVFGYDSEDVELFCDQVKVSYRITPESEEASPVQYGPPFIWSYGNPEEHFTPETKTFRSVFEVSPFSNSMLGDQRLFVVEKDGKFNIRLATQWPTHVRRSVAEALDCDISDVILHPQSYYAPYDQLIVFPAVLACIAALAARISGELVQLSSPMVSWQPHMTIEHETAYHDDGTILADRANCSIDLGAFPFFTSEVYHSILAGLVPAYPLKAAEVCILTNRSPAPPSNFFGDLGYAMALAGTENHFSQLAISLGMQPGIWKMARISSIGPAGIPLCESVKQGGDYDKLEKSAKEVLTQSWYSRKYAANTQKHLLPLRMNPTINYSRGIGFACGQSILGFSQQFNASANHYITVTMNENETLTVNIGIQADRYMMAIWKDTIRKFIDIPDEDIEFVDINDPGILDLGPNALARKTAVVPAGQGLLGDGTQAQVLTPSGHDQGRARGRALGPVLLQCRNRFSGHRPPSRYRHALADNRQHLGEFPCRTCVRHRQAPEQGTAYNHHRAFGHLPQVEREVQYRHPGFPGREFPGILDHRRSPRTDDRRPHGCAVAGTGLSHPQDPCDQRRHPRNRDPAASEQYGRR